MNPVEDTPSVERRYEESKGLIYHTAYKFWLLYGGELDEYSSVGHLAFMKTINSYNSEKTKFSTWLRTTMWQMLNDFKDSERGRDDEPWSPRRKGYRDSDKVMEINPKPLLDLLDELDDDAHEIVKLVLETPKELQSLIESEGNTMKAVKPALMVHMKDKGWSGARTGKAFKEIRSKL